MSCKTRVERRNERLQRLDEWQTGRFKRNRRQTRAEMGDVQDDSSPAAMRALAPIPVELCKPTRAVPPAPPSSPLPATASCQHKAGKAGRRKAPEKERNRRQAGGLAGQSRAGGRSGPEVATGWHSGTGKLKQQGEGVEQGWHVSPLRPRDLDAGPPGGSPQCGLLNERDHSGRFDGP